MKSSEVSRIIKHCPRRGRFSFSTPQVLQTARQLDTGPWPRHCPNSCSTSAPAGSASRNSPGRPSRAHRRRPARILVAARRRAPGCTPPHSLERRQRPAPAGMAGPGTRGVLRPGPLAIVPMGFCYPGTGRSGDLPPRAECRKLWHDRIFALLPRLELRIVIGPVRPGLPPGRPQPGAASRKPWPPGASSRPPSIPCPTPAPATRCGSSGIPGSPRNCCRICGRPWRGRWKLPRARARGSQTRRSAPDPSVPPPPRRRPGDCLIARLRSQAMHHPLYSRSYATAGQGDA
jgi:hypothetical protein